MRALPFVLLCVLCAFVVGCSQSNAPPPSRPKAPISTTERDTVKVYDHDGNLVLRLKADKKGYKVYDADETLLARLKDTVDHIKVEDEKRLLLKIKRRGKKYKTWVAENDQTVVQFAFGQRDDGGYELTDGYGRLLYTVRHKGDGFDVEDNKGQPFCRMSIVDGHVVATRADGFKLFEIRGSKSMMACSALVLDKFNPAGRGALFAFLHQLANADI